MMSDPPNAVASDWQLSLDRVTERGAHILTTAAWSDCAFLVGIPPVTVPAHRLFLAMTSPVFEAMLYGPMAEGKKPIPIEDVPHDVFISLLEYIYIEKVNTPSFEATCELYYAAKKYMLNRLARHCMLYLQSNVTTQHVCQAYEIAVFFEEEALAETCLRKIKNDTQKLLHESCFEEASVQTVQKIFSLDNLSIDNELVLLQAAERYIEARGMKRKETIDKLAKRIKTEDDNYVNMGYTGTSDDDDFPEGDDNEHSKDDEDVYEGVRSAVKNIRFLSLTPQQFASHAAGSPLLEPEDALDVLITLISKEIHLPEGFSLETTGRQEEAQKTKANPNDKPSYEGKAECIFEYTVFNFKNRKRRMLSDVFYVNCVPYRLELTPREREVGGKCLDIEVVCREEHLSEQWSCRMNITVKVVNRMKDKKHLLLHLEYTFTRDRLRAATCPLRWEELMDPNLRLLISNTLTFEVHVITDLARPATSRQTI